MEPHLLINQVSKRTASIIFTGLVEKFKPFIKSGYHGAGIFYEIIGQIGQILMIPR